MLQEITSFTINEYNITHKISENEFGTFYLGYDNTLDRHVTLRILADKYSKNPSFITSFFQSARSTASISHPNMVQIYDMSEEDDNHFIVSEYIEGNNLKKHLEDNITMPTKEIISLIIKICNLLKYTWGKDKVIHGNICSKYILLTHNGCRLNHLSPEKFFLQKSKTNQDNIVFFSSPESILKKNIDFRSDIYSLGIVLFQSTTGRFPFTGKDADQIKQNHIKEPIPNPRKYNKNLSQQFTTLIRKMLAKHPDDRYSSYDELIQDLQHINTSQSQNKKSLHKKIFGIISSKESVIWALSILLIICFSYITYLKLSHNLETERLGLQKKYEDEEYKELEKAMGKKLPYEPLQRLDKKLRTFLVTYRGSQHLEVIQQWQKEVQKRLKKIKKINRENDNLRISLYQNEKTPFEVFFIQNHQRDSLAEVITNSFKTNTFGQAKLILLKNFEQIPIEFKGWRNSFIEIISKAQTIYSFLISQRLSLLETTIIIDSQKYTITGFNDSKLTLINQDEEQKTILVFDLPIKHINHIINNTTLYSPIKNYNSYLASFLIWSKRYDEAKKLIPRIQSKVKRNGLQSLSDSIALNFVYVRNRIKDLIKDLNFYIELEKTHNIKILWAKLQKFIPTQEYKEQRASIDQIEFKINKLGIIKP